MRRITIGAAIAAMLFSTSAASAGEAEDLAAIKAQLNTMQREYDGKIRVLENRLAKAEADAKTKASTAAVVGN